MTLSKMTGFIHSHEKEAIPLFENFAYALSLFKTRQKEQIEKGKELITKLFAFEVEGSFPIYLHQYPKTYDACMPIKVLLVLTQIMKSFYHVTQNRDQYLACIERLFTAAQKNEQWYPEIERGKLNLLRAFWFKDSPHNSFIQPFASFLAVINFSISLTIRTKTPISKIDFR